MQLGHLLAPTLAASRVRHNILRQDKGVSSVSMDSDPECCTQHRRKETFEGPTGGYQHLLHNITW